MVDMYREGSLVWVQRKQGTWWPATILPPFNMSSSEDLPIMLLAKSPNFLDQYNVESKRVKPFRCGEFEHCIQEAESCESSICLDEREMSGDALRHLRRIYAILHALAIEKKEFQTKLKRAGDAQPETVCRAKRLKSTRVSVKSRSSSVTKSPGRLENSPSMFRIKIASSETMQHSSRNDLKKSAENPDHSQRKLRSMTLKKQGQRINWSMLPNRHTGGVMIQDENQKEKGDCCNERDASTNQIRFALGKRGQVMADPLAPNDTYINSIHSAQMMLVDVDVKFQKVSLKEQVPVICMISETSQMPIIGHPVDIEVVGDSSGIFLGKTNGLSESLIGRTVETIPRLVWRTAKRTPVCYSSTSEGPYSSVATQSFSDSKAKGRGYPRAPESPVSSKDPTMSTDHTLLHAVKNQAPVNARGRVNCVPVKHIFSRLLTAVG